MKIPELETQRLRLRAWREEDIQAYIEMCADPEVMRFLGGQPMTAQAAWRHGAYIIGHWQLRGFGHWVLEHKASGQFAGRAGFFQPEGWPGFEIGWALCKKFWGQGLAEEAARCALAYGFDEMGRNEVISIIDPGNTASIKLAEKLGERYLRDEDVLGTSVGIYGMDKGTWLKILG